MHDLLLVLVGALASGATAAASAIWSRKAAKEEVTRSQAERGAAVRRSNRLALRMLLAQLGNAVAYLNTAIKMETWREEWGLSIDDVWLQAQPALIEVDHDAWVGMAATIMRYRVVPMREAGPLDGESVAMFREVAKRLTGTMEAVREMAADDLAG